MSDSSPTILPPSKRVEMEQIRAEHRRISAFPCLRELLNFLPTLVVIVNECQQIVAASQRFCVFLDGQEETLLGMRIGEALHCIHLGDANGECGTSRFCETCGALQAILNTQRRSGGDVQECTLTLRTGEGERALDLRITAFGLDPDARLTVLAFNDIGDEKRRAVLEEIFFHDVLNTATGVRNLLEALPAASDQYRQETAALALQLVQYLIEEIQAGRDLAAAERGDLVVHVASLDAREILKSVCELYANHPVSRGKTVMVTETSRPYVVTTDKVLLKRVLGNLVKNALEASTEGQQVGLRFQNQGAAVFRVHNELAIPEAIQLQIFRRSFSTKSPMGRGIGTYSAKLITERYLGGSLTFTSSEGTGTTFTVTLPTPNLL